MTAFSGSVIRNPQYYFREGITWSSLANQLSLRYTPQGFVFESKGSMCYSKGVVDIKYLMGLLNSKVASYALQVLSPTLDFHEGPMAKVPVIISDNCTQIINLVNECVSIAKQDWDSMEISWDFQRHPLCSLRSNSNSITSAYKQWKVECDNRILKLKKLEEDINKVFINLYDLQDVLDPVVDDSDISITRPDTTRDIKSLLSYAVGCFLGRYSLDVGGIASAGKDYISSMFISFIPDEDNVIPITDEEYLEDDIVSRLCAWLKVVYGEETLEENLDFIAKALGN